MTVIDQVRALAAQWVIGVPDIAIGSLRPLRNQQFLERAHGLARALAAVIAQLEHREVFGSVQVADPLVRQWS